MLGFAVQGVCASLHDLYRFAALCRLVEPVDDALDVDRFFGLDEGLGAALDAVDKALEAEEVALRARAAGGDVWGHVLKGSTLVNEDAEGVGRRAAGGAVDLGAPDLVLRLVEQPARF